MVDHGLHGSPQYAASFVDQNYPATMTSSETADAWITYQNTGAGTWDDNTRLGTTVDRDRASAFYTPGNWINDHRPAQDPGSTAPGEQAKSSSLLRPQASARTRNTPSISISCRRTSRGSRTTVRAGRRTIRYRSRSLCIRRQGLVRLRGVAEATAARWWDRRGGGNLWRSRRKRRDLESEPRGGRQPERGCRGQRGSCGFVDRRRRMRMSRLLARSLCAVGRRVARPGNRGDGYTQAAADHDASAPDP